MVSEEVDGKRLETPLDLTPPHDSATEKEVVKKILEGLYSAKNPMILVDVLTARFHCTPEVRKLVDLTHFPVPPLPSCESNSYSPSQRILAREFSTKHIRLSWVYIMASYLIRGYRKRLNQVTL